MLIIDYQSLRKKNMFQREVLLKCFFFFVCFCAYPGTLFGFKYHMCLYAEGFSS